MKSLCDQSGHVAAFVQTESVTQIGAFPMCGPFICLLGVIWEAN